MKRNARRPGEKEEPRPAYHGDPVPTVRRVTVGDAACNRPPGRGVPLPAYVSNTFSTVVCRVQPCWERVAMAISQGFFQDNCSGPYLCIYRALTRGEPRWHCTKDSAAECELGWDVMAPVKGQEGNRRLLLVRLRWGWRGPHSREGID